MKAQITTTVLAALLFTAPVDSREAADLILFHGKVITVDKAFSIRSAIIVKGGRILAVGDDSLAEKYDAPTASTSRVMC